MEDGAISGVYVCMHACMYLSRGVESLSAGIFVCPLLTDAVALLTIITQSPSRTTPKSGEDFRGIIGIWDFFAKFPTPLFSHPNSKFKKFKISFKFSPKNIQLLANPVLHFLPQF